MSTLFYLSQQVADVPTTRDWLTPAEGRISDEFRFDKRRQDWLLGRWTAKLALDRCAGRARGELSRWQVLPDEDHAPCVSLDGRASPVAVSISHSDGAALCAVSPRGEPIGCDLEQIVVRDKAFVETFFTAAEQRAVFSAADREQPTLTTLLWSAKESVLKVLRKGLSVDTRRIRIQAPTSLLLTDDWQPLRASQAQSGDAFVGWWRHNGRVVQTLFGGHDAGEASSLRAQVNRATPTMLSGGR